MKTTHQIESETKLLLSKLKDDENYQKLSDELDRVKHLSHLIFMRRGTSNTKKNDESRLEKLEVQEKELESKVYAIIDNYKKEVEN